MSIKAKCLFQGSRAWRDAEETIPILDLGLIWREDGRRSSLAEQLRWASETIGFYFITNHGVDQALIDATFAEAARFHALPMEQKQTLLINRHQIGYLPMGGRKCAAPTSTGTPGMT